jgi:hypothetical protein
MGAWNPSFPSGDRLAAFSKVVSKVVPKFVSRIVPKWAFPRHLRFNIQTTLPSPFAGCLIGLLCLSPLSGTRSEAQILSGTVRDLAGAAIAGALVTHVQTGKSTTTLTDGTWTLTSTALQPRTLKSGPLQWKQDVLSYTVTGTQQTVEIGLYSTEGRQLKAFVNKPMNPGRYEWRPARQELSPGLYLLKARIGKHEMSFPVQVTSPSHAGEPQFIGPPVASAAAPKAAAAGDSLIASKAGYLPATLVLTAGQVTGIQFTLTPDQPAAEYKLPPPDACMNQFYAKGCVAGDPNSTCGGECRVANSCSPPEDPSKGNLPKNFICPRFMMFSSAMLQAAKDDARQYGWGNGADVPFQYGVVGHDADVGGLDDNASSCCQCYQLVFETPEPSSPQFPELPQPKSMVVQSFNTAASGPKGFDIFMGAGGYGAFNSCYNDAAFSNTTKFNEFLYQGFPWQNPGSGGISFLRYPECRGTAWPPTADGLKSAQCKETLQQQCNQAQSVSAEVTADTRNSCIQTNQLTSLYHQNWKVRAKRVQCPENLTRVTGCRLQEPTLPLPLPAVQTPAQAGANGTFTGPNDQYHTTTMQDCCMPTCAWSDWVEGKGLKPVEGWKSFYSCDKSGKPRTE